MGALGLALVAAAALVIAALLSSVPEVSAVRVGPAPLAGQTSSRQGASSPPPEQPSRKPAGNGNAVAAAARLDDETSRKPAVAAGGSSPASSAVFDPDRMSKRRVRRGSDPIHNKC